jgi:hypothetical protein
MADPTRERCPDYALAEFDNERIVFTVDGKTDEEAVEILRALWTIHHARDIGRWERQCEIVAEEEEQRREQAEQEAEQQRALQLEEEEEAKKEEKKKYKNKFAPIPDRPLPATALLLPSQHALSKLCKGDYVPLHLFTNKGIREAEEDGSGDEDLLTLVQTDKGPTFQTSASVKAKKHKVKDEALSWEEFVEANYRMLNAMRQQDWSVERLDMVRHFWLALEGHSWRHDPSEYRKRALLLYQGRVRRDWHKTLGTPDAFRLLPLQVGRLNDYHQELLDNAYAAKIEAMRTVCNFLANLTTHLTWHNRYFSPATPPPPSITSLHFHPIPMPHAGAHPMRATIGTRDQPHSSVLVSHTAKMVSSLRTAALFSQPHTYPTSSHRT